MHPAKPAYRPDIDGIRALAVLMVIVFHAFPAALGGGFIGVDIFFVISGFLISTILFAEFARADSGGLRVIGDFYGRRIRRIFPSLIVVLAACYALGFYRLLPDEFKRLGLHIAASAGFCQNLFLARETGYFDGEPLSKPLLHLWSLGIEEQFYLLWPLLVWLATRCRVRLLPGVVFLAGISFFCNEYGFGASNATAFFLPQMRLWELLVGSVTAVVYPSIRSIPAAWAHDGRATRGGAKRLGTILAPHFSSALSAIGFVLIGVGLFQITTEARVPNIWTLCPTLGTALLICAGETAWLNRHVLAHRALVWVGLISFPLYLWHWPLLCFSEISLEGGQSNAFRCLVIGVSFLLAWLTYLLIENPIRFGGRRTLKVSLLVAAMLSMGILGYRADRADGFPERFPPIIRELSHFSYKAGVAYRFGTYYLDPGQDQTAMKIDKDEIMPGKPTVYIWGDSHAAQLYPGFKAFLSAKYNIAQRTIALTPPLLGVESPSSPNVKVFNDFVFEAIKRDRPEYVVLAANWCLYADWADVGRTITALKESGIRHVIVVGPVPEWTGGLPQQIFNFVRTHPHEPLPYRLKTGLSDAPGKIEPQMEDLCGSLGAEYISPLRIFGNRDGFIIRFGDTADTLSSYDYGHLTVAGSEFLVSHFPMH